MRCDFLRASSRLAVSLSVLSVSVQRLKMAATLVGLGMGLNGAAQAATNSLSQIPLHVAAVGRVAIDPVNTSVVYALASGAFYRSTNGGSSWSLISDTAINGFARLATSSHQPGRVFAVNGGSELYGSADYGATLTPLSFPGRGTGSVVAYSSDGTTLYTASIEHFYKSIDNGASWTQQGDIAGGAIMAMAVDPANKDHIFVTFGNANQQSFDGGKNWTNWATPVPFVTDIAFSNAQPRRIWIATQAGVFVTQDESANWVWSNTGELSIVAVDPSNPQVIYSGGGSATLQRTTDGGASWNEVPGLEQVGGAGALAIDPHDSSRLFLGTETGLWKSQDGGAHWSKSDAGIETGLPTELTNSAASDRIYVPTGGQGVFAINAATGASSALNTAQLRLFRRGIHTSSDSLLVIPGHPDHLFVGNYDGVARSMDAGATWEQVPIAAMGSSAIWQIVTGSADAKTLVALAYDRIYRSVDGGDSWSVVGGVSGYSFMRVMRSAPSNPQVIYLVGVPGTGFKILKSTDGGAHWNALASQPAELPWSLAVDPADDRVIYAAQLGKLAVSMDGGASWGESQQIDQYIPFDALATDPQNSNILFAGGSNRVYRSADRGQSWQRLFEVTDTYRWYIQSLAVDSTRPSNLYVATQGYGVHEFSVAPDLQVAALAASPAAQDQTATFTFKIKNLGPFDATGIRAEFSLPNGIENAKITISKGTCDNQHPLVSCAVPLLKNAGSIDVAVTGVFPALGDQLINASVSSDQLDADESNNSTTSSVHVVEETNLSLDISAPDQVAPATTVRYVLTIGNAGRNIAHNVGVDFDLDGSLTGAIATSSTAACAVTSSHVHCNLPTLGTNASAIVTVDALTGANVGTFQSHGVVTASGYDPAASNNSAQAAIEVVVPSVPADPPNAPSTPSPTQSPPDTSSTPPATPPTPNAPVATGTTSSGGGKGGGGGSTSLEMLAMLTLIRFTKQLHARRHRGTRAAAEGISQLDVSAS